MGRKELNQTNKAICEYLSIVAYENQDVLTDQKSTLKFEKKQLP